MEIERFPNEGRVDNVVVDLCKDQVEACGLDSKRNRLGSSHQNSESGSESRSQYGNKLCYSGNYGKDGSVGHVAQGKIAKDDNAGKTANAKLAANVNTQCGKNPVEKLHDSPMIFFWEEICCKLLDLLAVLQQVEGNEDDNNKINELIEKGKEKPKGRLERIHACRHDFSPKVIELVCKNGRILQEFHVLNFLCYFRKVCKEFHCIGEKRAGNNDKTA